AVHENEFQHLAHGDEPAVAADLHHILPGEGTGRPHHRGQHLVRVLAGFRVMDETVMNRMGRHVGQFPPSPEHAVRRRHRPRSADADDGDAAFAGRRRDGGDRIGFRRHSASLPVAEKNKTMTCRVSPKSLSARCHPYCRCLFDVRSASARIRARAHFGAITTRRFGSSPLLNVLTFGWLLRWVWMIRRSWGVIGSSKISRRLLATRAASRSARRSSVSFRRSRKFSASSSTRTCSFEWRFATTFSKYCSASSVWPRRPITMPMSPPVSRNTTLPSSSSDWRMSAFRFI